MNVIKEQLELESNAVPWNDTAAFCHLVFQKMLDNMPTASDNTCFLDRGIPDVIAYLKAAKAPVPMVYYKALKSAHYAPVAFLFPPDQRIYINDNERQETFEEALQFFQAIEATYQLLGFTLYKVPLMSLEDRARYVLEQVACYNQ